MLLCHICKGVFTHTNCTVTVTEQTKCYLSISLEMGIQKSLQRTPLGSTFDKCLLYTTTYWWWQNQSAVSAQSRERVIHLAALTVTVVIYSNLYTVRVDKVYWQYNWKIWSHSKFLWLMICLILMTCIAKIRSVGHLFLISYLYVMNTLCNF